MHVVMTGATRGIGAEAARRLIGEPGIDFTTGVRGPSPAWPGEKVRVLPLDMARLASVDAFCDAVCDLPPIDALVLNAGVQLVKPQTSEDGFELTFAVNHLAHLRMIERLQHRLGAGARVILTGSGTHDPAEKTPVTPPVHARAEWLAFPDRDPHPAKPGRPALMRAYSSSKLCNIMTARELARRRPDLSVMAYDPAYVPGTGLSREYPRLLVPVIELIVTRTMAKDRSSTVALSGQYLAELATAPDYADCHGDYWSVRPPTLRNVPPSELARDDDAAAALWNDSLALMQAVAPAVP